MAEIPAAQPGPDGVTLPMGPAASGDTAKTGNHRVLLVRNGGGGSVTCTIAVPGLTATGEANPDNAVPIPAGAIVPIPLLPIYADPENNRQAAITWSGTTDVTRAVLQL